MAKKILSAVLFYHPSSRSWIHKVSADFVFSDLAESLQGGVSSGYKKYIAEKEVDDDTYNENGLALFRIQGSGPENMQAIQVDPVIHSPFRRHFKPLEVI